MTAAPVATDETVARLAPRRRGLSSRLSAGHIVMVVAGLLGSLLTLSLLKAADKTVPVAVAAGDLAEGERVDTRSFRLAEVRVDASMLDTLVPQADLASVVGSRTSRRIEEGELVRRSDLQLRGSGSTPRSMSFPIEAARAVGGELSAGDHVDVVAADDGGARYVLAGVEVLAVDGGGGSGALRAGDEALTVTLAVGPSDAVSLASALDGATVTLVRSTGSAPIEGALPSVAPPPAAAATGPALEVSSADGAPGATETTP